jgi:hypothetical protein
MKINLKWLAARLEDKGLTAETKKKTNHCIEEHVLVDMSNVKRIGILTDNELGGGVGTCQTNPHIISDEE